MVEGINFLIGDYGVVVEALLVHLHRSDIGPNIEGELLFIGGVDLGENIHSLVESPQGYLFEVVSDAELRDFSLVCDQDLVDDEFCAVAGEE